MAFIFGTEEAQVRGQQSDATETWSCHKSSNYSSHPCCFVPGPVIAPRVSRHTHSKSAKDPAGMSTRCSKCETGRHNERNCKRSVLSRMASTARESHAFANETWSTFPLLTVMPQWISSENLVHNFGVQCTACLQVEQIWLRARLGLKP
jgi:hypothetical protein